MFALCVYLIFFCSFDFLPVLQSLESTELSACIGSLFKIKIKFILSMFLFLTLVADMSNKNVL